MTDDAYVRGDLTPLSTKVAGIVKDVKVSDFQQVHKGDLLVELQDDDYLAQVAQANAAVEAAKLRLRTIEASANCRIHVSSGHSLESTRQMRRSLPRRPAKRQYKPMSCARRRNKRQEALFQHSQHTAAS